MESFATYVKNLEALFDSASRVDGERIPAPERPALSEDAPLAVLFSPHPDDEILTGGLPLRLRKEAGWRVRNVSVTLGSNPERREERANEMAAACEWIGFEHQIADDGKALHSIQMHMRRDQPHHWTHAVGVIGRLLHDLRPDLLVFPHSLDAHPTHIGLNALVRHAMLRTGKENTYLCLETEFWSPMEQPNLLVESSPDDVTELVTALTRHTGEIARNPYHLRLPAWLMDNVRRAGELMAGNGQPPPRFLFATPYRLRRWHNARYEDAVKEATFMSSADKVVVWSRCHQA